MEIFKLFGSVFVDTDKANESLSKTDKKAEGLGKRFADGAKTIAKWGTVIGGAVAGGAVAVGKMAMEFDASFAKVTTLLDSNTTDFDKYKKQIMDASKASGISVDQFSESVYGAISAGQDVEDAIGFTTEAMKLAKGGFTDGAKAVDVMTTALNGYKLDASEATRVSDLLITTQNLGKTTVDELASSMGKVIPIASAANYSIDELSATYATLTKNGIATAEAGTYTKAMLGELTKAGSKTDLALKELTGQGFAQLKESGESTTGILGMLSEYAEKSGMTLKDMFGSSEAGSAALVLMSQGGAEFNEILGEMANASGATDEAVGKMSDTVKEKWNNAVNAAKVSAIELGEKMLPLFEQLLDWVIENMPTIQATFEVVFDVISKVVSVASELIGGLIEWIKELSEESQKEGTLINDIWQTVYKAFKRVFEAIHILIESFVTWCKTFWDEYGESIMSTASKMWDFIKAVFQNAIDALIAIINFFIALFKGDFEGMSEAIKDIINAMWEFIKTLFDEGIKFLLSLGPTLFQVGEDLFTFLWDGIKSVWEGISSWVSEKVEWMADKLMFWKKSEKEMSTGEGNTKGDSRGYLDGSHANGLSYVPFDGYKAELHKGERVLTSEENKNYMSSINTENIIEVLMQILIAIKNMPSEQKRLSRMGVV